MKKIYVVGSVNTDLVITTPYMPKAGETLTGSGFFVAHGGKGANQAVAAARLGGKVVMCGLVGDDDFGKVGCKGIYRSRDRRFARKGRCGFAVGNCRNNNRKRR